MIVIKNNYYLVIVLKRERNRSNTTYLIHITLWEGDVHLWRPLRHRVQHQAGQDQTESVGQAPHGEDLLARVPIVGTLAE